MFLGDKAATAWSFTHISF